MNIRFPWLDADDPDQTSGVKYLPSPDEIRQESVRLRELRTRTYDVRDEELGRAFAPPTRRRSFE